MRFDILTLFPDMLKNVLGESIIGRGVRDGYLTINYWNIRDFTKNKHGRVDDYPYSGGGGMILQCEPIFLAYEHITEGLPEKPLFVYMTPQGKLFDQKEAYRISKEYKHVIVLCGHYEGVDERVIERLVDLELSIGDYVLTGGEIPAMVFVDAVGRLVDGVLASEESYQNESIQSGLLEYPQYTRPEEYEGMRVPEILLSGHHKNIEKWKKEQSVRRTFEKRPDLLQKGEVSEETLKMIEKIVEEKEK